MRFVCRDPLVSLLGALQPWKSFTQKQREADGEEYIAASRCEGGQRNGPIQTILGFFITRMWLR